MLGWIEKRYCQATGSTDERFGGKSIILVDDPDLLPPGADKPLFSSVCQFHTRPISLFHV